MGFDGDILCVRPIVDSEGSMGPFKDDLKDRIEQADAARVVLRTLFNDIKNVRDLPPLTAVTSDDTYPLARAILELMKMFGIDSAI